MAVLLPLVTQILAIAHRTRERRLLRVAALRRPAVLGPRRNVGQPRLEGCLWRLSPLHLCPDEIIITCKRQRLSSVANRCPGAQGKARGRGQEPGAAAARH